MLIIPSTFRFGTVPVSSVNISLNLLNSEFLPPSSALLLDLLQSSSFSSDCVVVFSFAFAFDSLLYLEIHTSLFACLPFLFRHLCSVLLPFSIAPSFDLSAALIKQRADFLLDFSLPLLGTNLSVAVMHFPGKALHFMGCLSSQFPDPFNSI